ncbi:hypothetical protein P4O66_005217 [Electrophorus voltai]|uniref:B30.2/SPRY domain-containing protein n=1 Tax=Electrophorus voltai TaxID=2609070 RepID=A0AAD9E703_9TELE|nr:hypothetical protein P4O66_005217 [Electrophorus voltai]
METPDSPSSSFVSMASDKSMEKTGGNFASWHPSATASQVHALSEPNEPQEERLCIQHCKPLEVFCKTDQRLICKLCETEEHRGHNKNYMCFYVNIGTKTRFSCSHLCVPEESSINETPTSTLTMEKKAVAEVEMPDSPSSSFVSMASDNSMDKTGDNFASWHPSATASQVHALTEPNEPQEERLCLQHHIPLEVFCKTDQQSICKLCATVEHRGHNKNYMILHELETLSLIEQTLDNVDMDKFMSYLCQNYPECFDTPVEILEVHKVSKLILERFHSEGALKITLKFMLEKATVLEKMLGRSGCIEVPKTLTQMYTHFLLIQTHLKNKKYHGMIQDEIDLTQSDKEMIIKLGKLAFLQLEKGNMIFYEKDLTECGIDVSKACEYSAICTEIFREEFGLYQEKVFCFVHLSIQEHLAAVYTQLQFVNSNMNILRKNTENQREIVKMSHLHKSAVDRALQSENGHFDLFLRFLLGLSLECNLVLLRGLLSKYSVESLDETVDYIKEKIRKEFSAERTINLFHCLNEINYNAILDEIHSFLKSGRHCETELKPDQCSALAYVLLTSDDVMNEFDMKMCNTSLEGYRRLLPVVRTSRRAILAGVNLTDESCETLALVLQSVNSHLTELDLSFNSLGDLGVKLLCAGLSSPHCKLEELNLSHNELEHIGVKLLCDCLMGLHCRLKILGLAGTSFSERSCELIASVFQSANSHLKELDLGCNNIRDSGVKLLSTGLISSQCKLEKLGLDRCDLTHESCEAIKTALQSTSSYLRELDLSYNNLGDSGVKQLCDGLTHPNSKLEKLDLSYNNLGDSGVKLLSAGLKNPDCKLKSISLCWCNLTERSCSNLATVLSSHTGLKELELRDNDLQDLGVKKLCVGLQDSKCTLQRLGLSGCCVTEEGCIALHFALSSNHSQLRELDLSYNHPGKSGVRQLYAILEDPRCKLEKLSVEHDGDCRNKPGLKKYACEITLDPNTAHRTLSLTGSKKVTMTKGEQPYPDHPDRFEYYAEALCREILHGARFYWEVEWTGNVVYIGVTYKGINRKGRGRDCKLGMNNKSWILFCSNDYGYYVSYNNKETVVPTPPNPSKRMGIYLDWQAGRLSYFIISPERVYHIYTFHTTFTEPLYPGIRVYNYDDTVTLCELE